MALDASPQTENGYTRIANELLEAILAFPFTKRELLVVLAIARKTYGYHKKKDRISLSQLSRLTGITRAHICETLHGLSEKQVLLKQEHPQGQVLGISKNYKNWKPTKKDKTGVPKLGTVPKTGIGCAQNGNAGVPKTGTTKETTTKETITKEITKRIPDAPRRIPPDWKPNASAISWIESYGVSVEKAQPVIIEFRAYWLNKSTRRKSWSATFMKNPIVRDRLDKARSGKPTNHAGMVFNTLKEIANG